MIAAGRVTRTVLQAELDAEMTEHLDYARALTASPISSSRIRTASNTSPSARAPRCKRLFLRHVARYWEVHRHRASPATARRIAELRCTGRLSVHRGNVTSVAEQAGRLSVHIDQDGTTAELTAGWLVNGTGPATDITRAADPLLRDLLGHGLARPDPLRLGIDADPAGAVLDAAGRPSSTIFTLGPPLRGLLYETTAILAQSVAAMPVDQDDPQRRMLCGCGAEQVKHDQRAASAAPTTAMTGPRSSVGLKPRIPEAYAIIPIE
jgi:hypothetical protein